MKDNSSKILVRSFLWGLVIVCTVVFIICHEFLITEVENNNTTTKLSADKSNVQNEMTAKETTDDTEQYLIIPVNSDVANSDLTVTNKYISKTIVLSIPGMKADSFKENPVRGKNSLVKNIYYEETQSGIELYLEMDKICEEKHYFNDSCICMEFIPVDKLYENIVTIDAGHGGSDTGSIAYGTVEKDVNIRIARKVAKLLQADDVWVLFVRNDDEEVSEESRVQAANEVQADLYISLHTNADEKTRITNGICTNYVGTSSINGLSSKKFAENLQEQMLKQTEAKDKGINGLKSKNEFLNELNMPAVMIQTGYITNKQEAINLTSDQYLNKLAQGIYDAILQSYDIMGADIKRGTK